MLQPDTYKPARAARLSQIIVLNLIPLFGVLFLKWDAKLLILTYFIETIITILFHAVRLWYVHWRWGSLPAMHARSQQLAAQSEAKINIPPAFLPLFMLAVFGMFCFVQAFILGGFTEKSFPEGIFTAMYRAASGELAWVLISFAMMQLIEFVAEVATNKYKEVPAEDLFFKPFRRVFIQQATVILGGFFLLLGGNNAYLIVLVLLNLAADLFFFFIENTKLKAALTRNNPEAEKQYDDMKRLMKE